MFKAPFDFEGRIRRTEFGLTLIIAVLAKSLVNLFLSGTQSSSDLTGEVILSFVISIPFLWLTLAQGAKRCHDVGLSGWFQLIPLFSIYLVFAAGVKGPNKYGDDPKYNAGITNF